MVTSATIHEARTIKKKAVCIAAKGLYWSESDGKPKDHHHDVELCDVLGQADTIIVEVSPYRQSEGAETKATLKAYHTSKPTGAPSDVGENISSFTTTITDLTPTLIQLDGPFQSRVEVVLTIEEATAPDTAQYFDMEVWATLIIN